MRALLVLVALVAALAGCGPSLPSAPEGTPGAAAPEVQLTAQATTTEGTLQWSQSLPLPISTTRQVSSLGGHWFLQGTDPDRQDRITQIVGRMVDGRIESQVTYDRAVGFPATTSRLSAGVQSTSRPTEFVVRAWDTTTGRLAWRAPLSAQGPQASVRVAGLSRDVVLVRPSIAEQGVFQLSSLVALRADDGQVAWRLQGTPGLRSVTPGPLVTVAYRADAQRDGPITRVAFVRPRDGEILTRLPWQDYRNHFRPAAIAVTSNRVLLRGDRDNVGDIHVAVVRADGQRVWQVSARAEPAVDFESRIIAIARRDGSVEARRLSDGDILWRLPPDDVQRTRLEVGRGAYGVFWGNAGPNNVVLDATTGKALFTGSISAVDPSRWNGQVLVTDLPGEVSGFSGTGWPIGFRQSTEPTPPLFVSVPP